MQDDYRNVAYTKEYLEYRKSCEWLFELEVSDVEKQELSEKFLLEKYAYENEKINPETGYLTRYSAIRALLKNSVGELIKEIKSIDGHFCAQLINHSGGGQYLIYNIDLYGYSVMDMSTYEAVDYIPAHSFAGGETFIWCGKYYCAVNNLLVVDGCYWACPWELEFYDFSQPMQLPLPKYSDSYQLSENTDVCTDDDITFAGFTQEGACLVKYSDEQNQPRQKIIPLAQLK